MGPERRGGRVADLEEPLIGPPPKTVVFYPNCPGCKILQRHQVDDGLPTKELSIVALLVVCNTLPIASLFPFIYFMVEDFQIAKSKDDIGYYVGALGFPPVTSTSLIALSFGLQLLAGSAFMIGRCLTSILWGMAADKYGRKPVIMVGVVSVVVLGTGFGLSTNFWFALAMRFLLGSFNGMLATAKAYSTEICSQKHQAVGVSIVGTFWGLGLIVGPAVGGYLSQPAIKYPTLFPPGSLFDRYPYLLPFVFSTIFAIVVLIICTQLPETLHNHYGSKALEGSDEEINGKELERLPLQLQLTRDDSSRSSVSTYEGIDSPALLSPVGTPFGSFKSISFERFQRSASGRSTPGASPYRPSEVEESGNGDAPQRGWAELIHEVDEQGLTPGNTNDVVLYTDEATEKADTGTVIGQEVAVSSVPEASNGDAIEQPLQGSSDELGQNDKSEWLLTNHPLMASIAVYCFWSLQDIAYTEIFSLWCVSPTFKDGLGYTTSDVGSLLALSGLGMLVFQLLFFPVVANFLGPVLTTRIGAAVSIPLLAVLPFFPSLHGRKLWVLMCVTSVLRFISSVTTLTGSFMLVNNSVAQGQRGAANGLSMSLASLFKAAGPACGGAIFAWAQSRQDAYILPGNEVVFFFLGVISFLTVISTFEPILPQSTNHPYTEEF